MKIILLLLLLLFSPSWAQWNLIQGAGAPYYTTGPLARPSSPYGAFWSAAENLYLLEGTHLWAYEVATGRWLWLPDQALTARTHAAVWDSGYVYGGSAGSSLLNDFHHYDVATRTFTKLTGGILCNLTASWSDLGNDALYFWGCKALHLYNISLGVWRTPAFSGSPPDAPYGAALRKGNMVFLYVKNEFWQLNLTDYAWTFLNVSDAGPRTAPHLWAGEESDSVILYGGTRNSLVLRDTWEWRNRTGWRLLEDFSGPLSPPVRASSYFLEADGTLWRYGPVSYIPHFDAALMAAVMSTLVFAFIFLVALVLLIRRCVRNKRSRQVAGLLRNHTADDDL